MTWMRACIAGCLLLAANLSWAASWRHVDSWQTQQGGQVYFVHTERPAIVDVAVAWPAGSAQDGQAQGGLANLTNRMLVQATDKQDSNKLSQTLDQLGVELDRSVDKDKAVIHMRMLADVGIWPEAGDLLGNIIGQPAFGQNDYERVQKQILTEISHSQQSPGELAHDLFYDKLFPKHPYGHPVEGRNDTVQSLQPDDLKAFYQQHYGGRNAVVVIVGKLEREQARRLSGLITRHLKPAGKWPDIKSPRPINQSKTYKQSFPSEQTHILMGHLGIPPDSPDRYALAIANQMLGGSPLISRLFQTVRNEHGLAYHVSSEFKTLRQRGVFSIKLQTRAQKAHKAMAIAKQTYENFVQKDVDSEQFAQSKKTLIDHWHLSLSDNLSILKNLLTVGFYHLPADALAKFPERIKQVNKSDFQKAVKKWLHPDKLLTVKVGGNEKNN